MNATIELERALVAWLEGAGPDDVPERVIEAALNEARAVRQRPAWLTSTRWASLEAGTMKSTQTTERVPTIPVTQPPLQLRWVVVALAMLLALIGGLLVIGALQDRQPLAVSACPPGTTPDEPGPIDQARPAQVERVIWDPTDGRSVLAFSPADSRTGATWRFDVCSNAWRQYSGSPTPVMVPGPTGVGLVPALDDSAIVNDVDSGLVVVFERNRPYIWSYAPNVHRWALLGERPFVNPVTAARDPVTGLIAVFGTVGPTYAMDGQMWTFDVDSGSWTRVGDGAPRLPWPESLFVSVAYDQAVDRFVLVAPQVARGLLDTDGQPLPGDAPLPGGTWLFDLRTRTWSPRTAPPAEALSFGGWGWTLEFETAGDPVVYDEANERVLAFGARTVAAYDSTAGTWELVWSGEPDLRTRAPKAFDPVNARVVTFARLGGYVPLVDEVAAFDLATRDWIVLDRVELQLED
jgi:hypothetical protein